MDQWYLGGFPPRYFGQLMRFTLPPIVGKYETFGFESFNPKKLMSCDTEATGLDVWGTYGIDRSLMPARGFMFQFCDEDGNVASIRFAVLPRTRSVLYHPDGIALANKFLSNEKLEKIFHNYPYDGKILEKADVKLRGVIHETMIRMHIINSESGSLGLKQIGEEFLDIPADDEADLQKSTIAGRRLGKKNGWPLSDNVKGDYHLADPGLTRTYGERDALRTMSLFLHQEEFFKENADQVEVYARELRAMHVIFAMEKKGTAVDKANVQELDKFYTAVTDRSQAAIKKITDKLLNGKPFNPNSSPQKQVIFFDKLGHTPLAFSFKKSKNGGGGRGKQWTKCVHCKGTGEKFKIGGMKTCGVCKGEGKNPKCDGDFLESIGIQYDEDENPSQKDPLAYNLLYNSAANTMMTFVKAYKHLMVLEDGEWVIHPNYRQAKVKTARLSCEKPNLQNVASDDSGKKRVDLPYRVRECFVPRKGKLFYIPDYSQIEIWLLALLSKDQEFIDSLAKGGDAHQIVADMIWPDAYDRQIVKDAKKILKAHQHEKDPDKYLTPLQKKHVKAAKMIRKIAKNLNFCKVYGGGLGKIALMSDSTLEQAAQFDADYDVRFPAVSKFMEDTIRFAKRHGYVKTPYDRVYRVDPNLAYRATNYAIQGTAADLMKGAMVNVHQLAIQKYPGKLDLLLQIHDELVIEADKSIHSETTMRAICNAMTEDYKFLGAPIRFPVGMKIATERWSSATEIELAA
jgi:DNA polymerase I-like protein with 3'-5' exonuclease and polymerase domains